MSIIYLLQAFTVNKFIRVVNLNIGANKKNFVAKISFVKRFNKALMMILYDDYDKLNA